MGKLKKEAVACCLFYIFTFLVTGLLIKIYDLRIEESKYILSLIPIREHPMEKSKKDIRAFIRSHRYLLSF